MGNTATFHIEIVDDTGDGTGHDVLAVNGDADVTQGTLAVTGTPDACTSTPPCDYTILTFTGTFTGPFAQEILPPTATVIYPTDPAGVLGEVFIRAGGLLPVELVSFESVLDGEVVRLYWKTASETNNAGFEVQRATDSGSFEMLHFVEGYGTTTEAQSYLYEDAAPLFDAQNLRYRLKQIDFDGAFAYSPLVEIDLATPEAFAIHGNFPNPFTRATTIRYALPRATHVRLVVYDLLGREVALLVDEEQEAGRKAISFEPSSSLASGAYLYRLETGSHQQSGKMVLMKK
jgi:hypothetical protein